MIIEWAQGNWRQHKWRPFVIGLATFIMVLACCYFNFATAAKYSAFVAALTVMDHSTRP